MQQHKAHLQQDLQLLGDVIGLAVGERLRAVPALQQEGLAALRRRQPLAQRIDLPGHDDRGQARELGDDALERLRVVVDGLLLRGLALPAGRYAREVVSGDRMRRS